jgi:hypothetical protein
LQFPEPVENNEDISRYIFDSNKIRPSDRSVRYQNFLPPKGATEISVYRVSGIHHQEIVSIGDQFVGAVRGQAVLAYALNRASTYLERELRFIPTELPHPRHANIVGLDDHAANIQKAQMLAAASTLVDR